MKPKWVIIGASGYVGYFLLKNLQKNLQNDFNFVGTYYSNPLPAEFESIKLDITDRAQIEGLLESEQPMGVILTAAVSQPNVVMADPARARNVNVRGPANVANACARKNIPLIHFSTDYVFHVTDAVVFLKEDDISYQHPINEYGRLKLEAEKEVRDALPSAIILRVALVYGWRPDETFRSNFLLSAMRELRDGKEFPAYTDQYGTPTYIGDIVEFMPHLMRAAESGKGAGEAYHLAGRGVVNRYEYAIEIANSLGLEDKIPLIHPVKRFKDAKTAPRPYCSALDTSKIQKEFNFTPCTLGEGLAKMKRETLGGNPNIL